MLNIAIVQTSPRHLPFDHEWRSYTLHEIRKRIGTPIQEDDCPRIVYFPYMEDKGAPKFGDNWFIPVDAVFKRLTFRAAHIGYGKGKKEVIDNCPFGQTFDEYSGYRENDDANVAPLRRFFGCILQFSGHRLREAFVSANESAATGDSSARSYNSANEYLIARTIQAYTHEISEKKSKKSAAEADAEPEAKPEVSAKKRQREADSEAKSKKKDEAPPAKKARTANGKKSKPEEEDEDPDAAESEPDDAQPKAKAKAKAKGKGKGKTKAKPKPEPQPDADADGDVDMEPESKAAEAAPKSKSKPEPKPKPSAKPKSNDDIEWEKTLSTADANRKARLKAEADAAAAAAAVKPKEKVKANAKAKAKAKADETADEDIVSSLFPKASSASGGVDNTTDEFGK